MPQTPKARQKFVRRIKLNEGVIDNARFELESTVHQLFYCMGDFKRGTCSIAMIRHIHDNVLPMLRVIFTPEAVEEFCQAMRQEITRTGGNPNAI